MKDKLPDLHLDIKDLNSKSTVTIKADKAFFSAARHRTTKYKALPFLYRPVLEKIADYIKIEMISRTFEREGPGWTPLARRTVAERVQAGYDGQHPILRRSGDLFKELTEKSHPKHIEIIKTGKNARIEIGGSSQKFIQNQMGDRTLNLPARPMIPGTGSIPLEMRDKIAIETIIVNAIKNK